MTDKYPKRKAIPKKMRAGIIERQDGICACGCGEPLDPDGEGVDVDHDPALGIRPMNEDHTDYIPAQLDPKYLFALRVPCHIPKSVIDTKRAAKVKRSNGETGQNRKWKRKLKSPGFDKTRTRKFNGEVKVRKTQ